MEEAQSHSSFGGDRSTETAAALRAWREQADQMLDTHRRRVGDIEAELNRCVQQIAEELAEDRAASLSQDVVQEKQQVVLEQTQSQLAHLEAEASQLRTQLRIQADEHEFQLDEVRKQSEESLAVLQSQLEQQQQEIKQLCGAHEHARQTAEAELCEFQEQLGQQQSEYEEQEGVWLEQLEQRDQQLQELQKQLKEAEATERRLSQENKALCAEREQDSCDQSELMQQLDEAQQTIESFRNKQCDDCTAAQAQIAELQQQQHDIEQQLVEKASQFELLSKQRNAFQESLVLTESNYEKATALLKEAEQQIVELSRCAEYEEELEQTKRKFELALADVHKLKKENTELHEELVRRPEVDQQESAELVSLRAERDALANQLTELQDVAQKPVDADVQQRMADLQQRFEMAVDDVRQLKQQNAELQQRVDAVRDEETSGDSLAGMDWQAQKARLLASLASEENEAISPERNEERTTIHGTISITDRVVAEKDQIVSELESQVAKLHEELDSRPSLEVTDELKRSIEAEVLADDTLVQAERSRLAKLQKEMQDKLREAELEISVQRATLARQHAELQEKLANFQEADAQSTSEDGKPRRRWLSALGIKEDEET